MKLTSISTIAFLIISIITLFAKPCYPTYPGANGVVSYSHVNGPYEYGSEYHMLRTQNPDGTGRRDVQNKYYRFTWIGPWSPDGTRYVYERGDVYPHELWLSNYDGSYTKKITSAVCTVADPSWSPDGTMIIFQDCIDGNVEIYTSNIDGSNRRRLTNNPAWEGQASWSPDGSKIVYQRDGSIWIMDDDGKNPKQLTHDLSTASTPDWSPNGKNILYNCSDPGGLCIINSDGSNKISTGVDCGCSFPRWSPDGKKILVSAGKGFGGLLCGVFTINNDGTDLTLITSKSKVDDRNGGWQPLPKANRNITLSDTGFLPSITHAHQGWKVRWNFLGENPQAVVDDLAMGMFGSGMEPKGGAYATTFYDAGIYQTFDPTSKRSGSIYVPVKVTPASVPVGTAFTVKWSTRNAPAGMVFDVQEKRPDSTAWLYYLRGVKTKSATVTPTQAGTYLYRARLRGRTGTVYWSPSASMTVE